MQNQHHFGVFASPRGTLRVPVDLTSTFQESSSAESFHGRDVRESRREKERIHLRDKVTKVEYLVLICVVFCGSGCLVVAVTLPVPTRLRYIVVYRIRRWGKAG